MAKKTVKKSAKKSVKQSVPKRAAKKKVAAIPAGYHTLTPYIVVRGAAKAIEWYEKALGAKKRVVMPAPDGSVMHAELAINGSALMMGDENLQMGAKSPETIGGSASGVHIYVADTDKLFARAVAAGATVEMPPADMFWGDRYCKFVDPFGHKWSIATHIEDVSPKEMGKRAAAEMARMAAAPKA
jgi:PhnB protein